MIRRFLVTVVSLCIVCSGTAAAASKGSGSHGSGHRTARASSGSKGKASTKPAETTTSRKKYGAARTTKGRIARSAAAKHTFEAQTGYPHGRPGYVVDHITPLACGGVDAPSNMQWQTIAAARAKDKVERAGCR